MAAKDKSQDQAKDQATGQNKTTDGSSNTPSTPSKGDISADPIQPKTINQSQDQQKAQSAGSQSKQEKDTSLKDTKMDTPPTPSQDASSQQPEVKEKMQSSPSQPSQSQQTTSQDQMTSSTANTNQTMPNQDSSIGSQGMDQSSQSPQSMGDESQPAGSGDQDGDSLPQVTQTKSRSKYPIVLSILLIFALAGIGFAGYQFYQTRIVGQDTTQQEQDNSQQPTTEPTPVPPEISLENGNVVSTTPDGEKTTIINKSNFETTGITGFMNVLMSPDGSKFCTQTQPPAPQTALYVSDVTGSNVQEVGVNRKDCFWLADDQTIVYEDVATEGSGSVNIYKFDYETGEETILTTQTPEDETRIYNIENIADDGETILCTFTSVDQTTEQTCEINSQTGAVEVTSQGEVTPIPTEEA